MFVAEGIVVQPNEKYVKKLLELYDRGRLKRKAKLHLNTSTWSKKAKVKNWDLKRQRGSDQN